MANDLATDLATDLNEALRINYSRIGSALIEQLYDEAGFLSLSGEQTTDELAALAGIGAGTHVLDMGCGLGGPAMRLARRLDCQVVGIDLVETNVDAARERVAAAGLAHRVTIHQGDALALAWANGAFDVVWSQDAWCHVPDKPGLVAEAARLAKPQGVIAFTDWVATGAMDATRRAIVLDALAAANLETMAGYGGLLESHGCTVERADDISPRFAARYDAVMTRLRAMEGEIVGRFSQRVFDVMVQKNGALQAAFADGVLGGCQIVARKS